MSNSKVAILSRRQLLDKAKELAHRHFKKWNEGVYTDTEWNKIFVNELMNEGMSTEDAYEVAEETLETIMTEAPFLADPVMQMASEKTALDALNIALNDEQSAISDPRAESNETNNRTPWAEKGTEPENVRYGAKKKECRFCGKKFTPKKKDDAYCCHKCQQSDIGPEDEHTGSIDTNAVEEAGWHKTLNAPEYSHYTNPALPGLMLEVTKWGFTLFTKHTDKGMVPVQQGDLDELDGFLRGLKGKTAAGMSMRVQCMECGKKFRTSSMVPECPKCHGTDIEPDEGLAPRMAFNNSQYNDMAFKVLEKGADEAAIKNSILEMSAADDHIDEQKLYAAVQRILKRRNDARMDEHTYIDVNLLEPGDEENPAHTGIYEKQQDDSYKLVKDLTGLGPRQQRQVQEQYSDPAKHLYYSVKMNKPLPPTFDRKSASKTADSLTNVQTFAPNVKRQLRNFDNMPSRYSDEPWTFTRKRRERGKRPAAPEMTVTPPKPKQDLTPKVDFHETPTKLPPRDDMRRHLTEEVKDEIKSDVEPEKISASPAPALNRTIMPKDKTPQSTGYKYDPYMKTDPIAEDPNRKSAPSWVTGALKEADLGNDIKAAFQAMVTCDMCKNCLKNNAIIRLIEHLKADHHLGELAQKVAHEAFKRVHEYKRGTQAPAPMMAARKSANPEVQQAWDSLTPRGRCKFLGVNGKPTSMLFFRPWGELDDREKHLIMSWLRSKRAAQHMATDNWLDFVAEQEEDAKMAFMSDPRMKELARMEGIDMEQLWAESRDEYLRTFHDPMP